MKLKVKLLSENASLPTRAHSNDAGIDIRASEDFTVKAGGYLLHRPMLAFGIPKGHYLQVATKSGHGTKKLCMDIAGVIDEGYIGSIGIPIWNFSDSDWEVKKGDKIAQLLCVPVSYPEIVEVTELEETDRGSHGFGSGHEEKKT